MNKIYFLRYKPTSVWLEDTRNFKEFSGTIEFYDEVADHLGSLAFNNGETQNNNLGQNRTRNPNTRQNDELECTVNFIKMIGSSEPLTPENPDDYEVPIENEILTYYYEINCESTPVGGPNDDDNNSGNPTDPNNNNNGDDPHGTGGNSGGGETGDDGDIETEPVFVEGEILDCINSGVPGDETTLEIDSFIETGLSSIDLALINDFLKANQCSEAAQWCAIQVFESGNIFDLEDCGQYDPCGSISQTVENIEFASKMDDLDDKTNLLFESGYSQKADSTFTELNVNPTSGGHTLDIAITDDMVGFLHTHIDNYENGEFYPDGTPKEIQPIKIFSPADIITFLKLIDNANTNNIEIADVYGMMVSSTGNYMLKFTGSPIDAIISIPSLELYNEDNFLKDKFKEYILDFGRERGFLKFIKHEIGVEGIELFKIKDSGRIRPKTLNENERLETGDC